MALGKTLVEDYEHIWSGDTSLDRDADDFDLRYNLYLDDGDESHLPIKPSANPVRWVVRHLPPRIVRRMRDQLSGRGSELAFDACAYAIVGVKGLTNGDGNPASVDRVKDLTGYERVTDSDMGVIDREFPGLIDQIGAMAITRSVVPPK